MLEQNNSEKTLKEIERQNEVLEREKQQLFEELGITPGLTYEVLKNRSFLSLKNQKIIDDFEKNFDEELEMRLENIYNREKTKKTLNDRNLPPWALFCK